MSSAMWVIDFAVIIVVTPRFLDKSIIDVAILLVHGVTQNMSLATLRVPV